MTSIDILAHLIGFDTVSRKSNLSLIEWVSTFLKKHGVMSDIIYDETGGKAHLWATIGPKVDGGIILSGHTDVVPVDGQDWTSDPFKLTERDGLLYGRGTSDMKGFLAVVLNAVAGFQAAALQRPVHLAFSYDEEIGCIGVPSLIEAIRKRGLRPQACIVGEPTMMQPVVGQKGILSARAFVRGLECHSSMAPEGVNAIMVAARIIEHIREANARRLRDGPKDARFTPDTTTLHVGTIQGGTALNIVPRDCSFEVEIRSLPSEDPAAILADIELQCQTLFHPDMQAISPETGLWFETMSSAPALDTDPRSAVADLARHLTGSNDSLAVSYATEAGFFHSDGIQTIICGPGSIAQAHKPNEFIDPAQLQMADKFMGRLIEALSRPLAA
jgi:acetylornithine deacetylase